MGRTRLVVSGVALVVGLAGVLAWALWPDQKEPPPREREYLATTACLLTPETGLDGEPARAAWAGMRSASDRVHVKIQQLAVRGPQTEANALQYFNTLALQKCALIVAVGDGPVAAAAQGSPRFTGIRYATVGGSTVVKGAEVVPTTSTDVISSRIDALVAALATGDAKALPSAMA